MRLVETEKYPGHGIDHTVCHRKRIQMLPKEKYSGSSDTGSTMPYELFCWILLVWFKEAGPGCPPKWVDRLMATDEPTVNQDDNDLDDGNGEEFEPESETLYAQNLTALTGMKLV